MKKELENEIETFKRIIKKLEMRGDRDLMYFRGIRKGLQKALNILEGKTNKGVK